MSHPFPKAHRPNLDHLRIDLYQLLAVFMASRPIAAAALGSLSLHRELADVGDIERDLATRLLLSIAVTVRVLDDREDGQLEMLSTYVGTLTEDSAELMASGGLTLREACNKIIHAKGVDFAASKSEGEREYLEPFVYFTGSKGRRVWNASLNVMQFVREGLYAVDLLQEQAASGGTSN